MTLTLFTDIPVVPVTRVHQHVALGGPIWPDFDRQTWVRHCRDRNPWDDKPDLPERLVPFDGAAVWGGFLDNHFGHFVADHLSRLALALHKRPGDTFLFTVEPGMTRERLAPWVSQVFDWIGLSLDQVHLVTEGLYVAALHVTPQAEMLAQVAPTAAYLKTIAQWGMGLQLYPVPLLYVSRLGMPHQGGGAHAGESYLVTLLRRLGVAVIDPAQISIRAQMEGYAGAARLVFAEGSALHGRQLLGHVPQRISVLLRRLNKRMAEAALTPRCDGLTYHAVSAGRLMAYWKNGTPRPDPALSLYDVPALHRAFQGFGIDLTGLWSDADYRHAACADIAAWTAAHDPEPKRLAEHRVVLQALGLT